MDCLMDCGIWAYGLRIDGLIWIDWDFNRDCYGLVDSRLILFIRVARMNAKIASYMFFFCLTIWRYLFIVVWKRMRGVQDNFFSTFISLSIYAFSAWFTVAKLTIGFHPNQVLFIYLSDKPMTNSTTPDKE